MKSLLNTNDIIRFNNDLLIATDGGLYSYDDNIFTDYSKDLKKYDLSVLSINNDNLWIGNNDGGTIQIFNNQMTNIANISLINMKDIYDIVFSSKYAFILANTYDDINQLEIYQYNIEDLSNLYYISKINIPFNSSLINDIEVLNETLYISIENSLISIDELDNINFSDISNWNELSLLNISKLLIHDNNLCAISGHEVYLFLDDSSYVIINTGFTLSDEKIEHLVSIDDQRICININNQLYIYSKSASDPSVLFISKIIDLDSDFSVNSLYYIDNIFYLGLENKGIAIYDSIADTWLNYLPNTIFKNQFDSLALTT